MNAIAQRPETGAVVQADAASIMAIIDRASRDPATDMDKLERLLGMYERLSARNAEQAFAEAMNAAQGEMERVRTDSHNPQTKSRYASFPALDRACRPIYARHGFSLSYDTGEGAPADYLRVVCYVTHNGGHSRTYHVDMPADGKGAKGGDVMTKTHATGAAMSYGQRYLLKLIFNIAVGEDADGNDPAAAEPINFDQQAEIQALMEEVGANREAFLNFLHCDSIALIPQSKFKRAMQALEKKRGR